MLHLAAYGGFAIFDVPLPVNGIVGNLGQSVQPAVDAVCDGRKLGTVFDLLPFLYPKVGAIPINRLPSSRSGIPCR